jgi:hypothetical protein
MRDLRGLIKKDQYDEGGWCFDEKRNLFNKKIIRVEFSSDKSLKVYTRFFREKRFIKKQDFWLESESIVCC